MDQTLLIAETPGFTPQIGRLVSMMHYVRSTTLAAVAGLGIEELDYLHDPQSNSIGALLLHIAAISWATGSIYGHLRGDGPGERCLTSASS